MPNTHTFNLFDQDLVTVLDAQRLIQEALGVQEVPLDVLVPIAVRCADGRELADAVLHSLRTTAARRRQE